MRPGTRIFKDSTPFLFEEGGSISSLDIEYETWGELSPARDNVILLCPSFSSHSHARSHPGNPEPGWWEGLIGPGMAFDSHRFFIICASLLSGSHGTTGPKSINPETAEPYGADFPLVTLRDIVDTQIRLLDHLEIERVFAAAGGSMGAMEAIDLSVRYPERAHRIIAISGTAFTRAYTATIRHVGRRAIMLDPAFECGCYRNEGPEAGLKLAREIGTIYYRSRQDFNTRFSCAPTADPSLGGITFDFQSYLNHMGNKVLGVFDANSYLRLSLSMDLHDIGRGFGSREEALQRIQASYLVVGVEQDLLIPIDEQKGFHDALIAGGKQSQWCALSSRYGHDAFLKEFEWQTPRIRSFLETGRLKNQAPQD